MFNQYKKYFDVYKEIKMSLMKNFKNKFIVYQFNSAQQNVLKILYSLQEEITINSNEYMDKYGDYDKEDFADRLAVIKETFQQMQE